MRIQLMSDLHLPQWGKAAWASLLDDTQTDADALVLAGDVVSLTRRDYAWSVARLKDFAERYPHVAYVPGNHEYYGTGIDAVDLEALEAQTGVRVLRPGVVVEVGGQRILGGTMFQPHTGRFAEAALPISDHYHIDDFATAAPTHYAETRAWLEAELQEGDIVVTHHAPGFGSLAPQYVMDPCNRWFITPEISDVMHAKRPALWMHGHTHTPFDYVEGVTRVVCNPRGYPGEDVAFNPKLVLEAGQ